jgi:4-hydroxybenzoate polyprenyltransferase
MRLNVREVDEMKTFDSSIFAIGLFVGMLITVGSAFVGSKNSTAGLILMCALIVIALLLAYVIQIKEAHDDTNE